MPQQLDITLNLAPLDAADEALDEFGVIVVDEAAAAYDAIEASMLADLRDYPVETSYPIGEFPWKSRKQQIRVLILLKEKAEREGRPPGDIKYLRTGQFGEGWYSRTRRETEAYTITLGNDAVSEESVSILKFIMGKLNLTNREAAIKDVQPFHAPRWDVAADTINDYLTPYFGDVVRRVSSRFIGRFTSGVRGGSE